MAAIALAVLGGCGQADAPDRSSRTASLGEAEREMPVVEPDATRIAREFGLAGCSDMTRLRDVLAGGYLAESWRVQAAGECLAGWADRQERYALTRHAGSTKAERARLPWLCGETGEHVAQCARQMVDITHLVEQPRSASFLLLRRLTKVPG